MSRYQRMGVHSNQYQGYYKKVLTVCSAGILRSATAAHILSAEPYNFNTRNVGIESYALIPLTEDLLMWADEIVCMQKEHQIFVLKKMLEWHIPEKRIIVLNIEDIYEYRHPELVRLIIEKYDRSQEKDPIIESPPTSKDTLW
jgi:predicted protein tyrosine phosphatase